MTVERYNTPNHPRWSARTTDASTTATAPQQRYGRSPHRDGGRPDASPRTGSPLVSRDATEDETPIELRNTSDRVWITADLPDRSLDDDIHVSVHGASIRIQARSSDGSPEGDSFDRTITLAAAVNPADVVLAYDDPTLTVIVPNEGR